MPIKGKNQANVWLINLLLMGKFDNRREKYGRDQELSRICPPAASVSCGVADRIIEAHRALLPLLARFGETGATDQFAPGPDTNRVFTELCELVTSSHGPMTDIRERLRPVVTEDIRMAAQLAETEMERHYAQAIITWAGSDPAVRTAIREGATRRAPEAADRLGLPEEVALRLELLRGLVACGPAPFPYFKNYELMMVEGEHPLIDRLLPLHRHSTRRVAFLGSGPLDLSADLLCVLGGPRTEVVSVDCDEHAVEYSRRLQTIKEELGILERGQKQIVKVNAEELSFDGRKPFSGRNIPVDAVFLASMLDTDVRKNVIKECFLSRVGAVLTRDAAGLVGELLYHPVQHDDFASSGYPLTCCTVPLHQVLNGTGRPIPATHWMVAREILNCTWGAILSEHSGLVVPRNVARAPQSAASL